MYLKPSHLANTARCTKHSCSNCQQRWQRRASIRLTSFHLVLLILCKLWMRELLNGRKSSFAEHGGKPAHRKAMEGYQLKSQQQQVEGRQANSGRTERQPYQCKPAAARSLSTIHSIQFAIGEDFECLTFRLGAQLQGQ